MRRLGAAALVVSIALACGGGSGSGDGQLTRIDATTAENVARSVMLSLDLTADLSTIGSTVAGGGALSMASTAAANGMRIALVGFVPLAAGTPIGPILVDCQNSGGTVTLTGTITTPDTLTPGDRFTGDFVDCELASDSDEPPHLDGRLAFTVVTFAGDLTTVFSLTLDLQFVCVLSGGSACDPVTVTEGADSFAVDGRVRTAVDATAPPLLRSSASGSTLALTEPAPPATPVDSVALRGFQTTLSQDSDKKTFELTGTGSVASTGFDGDPTTDDGEVRYEVTTTLNGDIASLRTPTAGIVLVTGSSSAMQIVPQADGTHVDLELDLDGNGSFDVTDTIHTTWADLGL